MILKLFFLFFTFILGFFVLRNFPYNYASTLISFWSILSTIVAIYIVISYVFKEQIEFANKKNTENKVRNASWSVYLELTDFCQREKIFHQDEKLFLLEKAQKSHALLKDKFTDTAKNWFIEDLIAYYEYIYEQTNSFTDFAKLKDNVFTLDYIDNEVKISFLKELAKIQNLHKELFFIRQTVAFGKLSAQFYKSYIIIENDSEEISIFIKELVKQLEKQLKLTKDEGNVEPSIEKIKFTENPKTLTSDE